MSTDDVSTDETTVIRRLVGVYNAEGTLRGELAYWFGRRRGTAHCALCDITHGSIRERSDWKECRASLPVEFTTFHLDDQPAAIRASTAGRTPAVLAETDAGPVVLLGPDELERCQASPASLVDEIDLAAKGLGLEWP